MNEFASKVLTILDAAVAGKPLPADATKAELQKAKVLTERRMRQRVADISIDAMFPRGPSMAAPAPPTAAIAAEFERLCADPTRAAEVPRFYAEHKAELIDAAAVALTTRPARAPRPPATAQQREDQAHAKHFTALVDGGHAVAAAEYYGEHRDSILRCRGGGGADDNNPNPNPTPEGTCNHCGGSGLCRTCEGTEDGAKKCVCHVCSGSGKAKP
jgi:hypothetical protein